MHWSWLQAGYGAIFGVAFGVTQFFLALAWAKRAKKRKKV